MEFKENFKKENWKFKENRFKKKTLKGYIPSYLDGNELCVVCKDKATGYHYRCITCEGCKGFFRRTVQKELYTTYQCKQNGSCPVNKFTRNQCQRCRYNKCLEVGMATSLVLNEDKRIAKRRLIEQNRRLRKSSKFSESRDQFIQSVTLAYTHVISNKMDLSFTNTENIKDQFCRCLTAAITSVVDFAKRLKLFTEQIETNDQVSLLKRSCMEVIVFRAISQFDTTNQSLPLFPYVTVSRDQLRQTRLADIAECLISLGNDFSSYNLTWTDYALLEVAIILSADTNQLTNQIAVQRVRSVFTQALNSHVTQRWKNEPFTWMNILGKLSKIRVISNELASAIMNMTSAEMEILLGHNTSALFQF